MLSTMHASGCVEYQRIWFEHPSAAAVVILTMPAEEGMFASAYCSGLSISPPTDPDMPSVFRNHLLTQDTCLRGW